MHYSTKRILIRMHFVPSIPIFLSRQIISLWVLAICIVEEIAQNIYRARERTRKNEMREYCTTLDGGAAPKYARVRAISKKGKEIFISFAHKKAVTKKLPRNKTKFSSLKRVYPVEDTLVTFEQSDWFLPAGEIYEAEKKLLSRIFRFKNFRQFKHGSDSAYSPHLSTRIYSHDRILDFRKRFILFQYGEYPRVQYRRGGKDLASRADDTTAKLKYQTLVRISFNCFASFLSLFFFFLLFFAYGRKRSPWRISGARDGCQQDRFPSRPVLSEGNIIGILNAPRKREHIFPTIHSCTSYFSSNSPLCKPLAHDREKYNTRTRAYILSFVPFTTATI